MSKVMYWLNVDFLHRTCTVHKPSCIWKPGKAKFKNVRSMGRDGGWMPFSDYPLLVKYKRTRFNGYELCFCSFCKTHAQMSYRADGKLTISKTSSCGDESL